MIYNMYLLAHSSPIHPAHLTLNHIPLTLPLASFHIRPDTRLNPPTLLAQPQRVLGILLRPSGRARGIAYATGRIFGHVADALGRVT